MTTDLVLEIGALTTDTEADAVIEYAMDKCHAGVVVKGTQGTRWARANAGELLHDAQRSGLQGAWLHYAEPAVNTAADEAVALLTAIGARPMGLGIWLELDVAPGTDTGALGQWATDFCDACSTPRRPVALLVASQLSLQVAGYVPGIRVVLTERDESGVVTGWATRDEADLEVPGVGDVPIYVLSSVRGLVPVNLEPPSALAGAVALAVVPPEEPDAPGAAEAPPEPDEAEEHTGSQQSVDELV